jgi:hypothetical protein
MDKSDIYHLPAANVHGWNRTLCSVLEEMRRCYDTRNFAPLSGLIEEAQTYANRMEAKLSDVKDYRTLKARYKKLSEKAEALKRHSQGNDGHRHVLDLD